MAASVNLEASEAPVVIEADVVVCGAGSAGLGAALSSARSGMRVALVERWPFFGGNATAASLGSICGLYVRKSGEGFEHISNGIAREWAQGLSASGWGLGPIPYKETAVMPYVPWGYKRLADRLITEEERITPLLHSFISGVVRSGDAIEAVVIATKQGPKAVRGRLFIDATGDADIVFHAGSPWEMGDHGTTAISVDAVLHAERRPGRSDEGGPRFARREDQAGIREQIVRPYACSRSSYPDDARG